jgi:hypothetical protein
MPGCSAVAASDGHALVSYPVMQVISFKNTPLFKRGMWLSAAALLAFVAAPSVLNGTLWRDPLVTVIPLCILCGFEVYFFRKMQIHRLADEVMDCEDHLRVRRGRTEEIIPFSKIASAGVSTAGGIHRLTIRLEPLASGAKIEFLPQASLWASLRAVQRVANNLTERAQQAKGGRAGL